MFTTKCTVGSSKLDSLTASYRSLVHPEHFEKKYGSIAELLSIDVHQTLLRAALEIYDPSVRGFVLRDIVLVPLVEEYRALLQFPAEGHNTIIPRFTQPDAVGQLSKLLRVPKFVLNRFNISSGGLQGFDWEHLRAFFFDSNELFEASREYFVALGIYVLILFPTKTNFIDYSVLKAFGAKKLVSWDPVPAILTETFVALNRCATNGRGNLECCLPLLTIWFLTHLPLKINSLNFFTSTCFTTAKPLAEFQKIAWPHHDAREWARILTMMDADMLITTPFWYAPLDFLWKSGGDHCVSLVGIRGVVDHAPVLAFWQNQDCFTIFDIESLGQGDYTFDFEASMYGSTANKWKTRVYRTRIKTFKDPNPLYLAWHQAHLSEARIYQWIDLLSAGPSAPWSEKKLEPTPFNWQLAELQEKNLELEDSLAFERAVLRQTKGLFASAELDREDLLELEQQAVTEKIGLKIKNEALTSQVEVLSKRTDNLRRKLIQTEKEKVTAVEGAKFLQTNLQHEHEVRERLSYQIIEGFSDEHIKLKACLGRMREKEASDERMLNFLKEENTRLKVQVVQAEEKYQDPRAFIAEIHKLQAENTMLNHDLINQTEALGSSIFTIDELKEDLALQKKATEVMGEEMNRSLAENQEWRRLTAKPQWEQANEIMQLNEQLQVLHSQARMWGRAAKEIYPKIMQIRVQAMTLTQANFLSPSSIWTQFLEEVNRALEDFPLNKK